ncbi:MAG: NAD-dependent epimerase/dehydratase family protein [Gemmatimonadales bacterium]|nr:NAD-dependent epimerase/dehydratase family protein [Gemmatimonadales bacterium]
MRAFLTGATGFVGSHVAEALLARGDTVVCLARQPGQAVALAARGAEVVGGTLDATASLERVIAGVDVVYHVAGLVAGSEAEYFDINEAGTRRLAESVRLAAPGSRFVYISSQAAVGPGRLLDEDAPCRPVSPYGRSKLAGEVVVRESGLAWTIVRPPSVYGPRDRAFLTVFKLAAKGIAPVFGRGRQELSLIFVPDLAEVIVRAGTHPAASGRVYHVAHSETVTAGQLALEVGRAVGRKPLVIPVPRLAVGALLILAGALRALVRRRSVVNLGKLDEFFASAWTFDVGRAERELGWRAAHGLGAGARETAAWYRAEGWL